MNLMTNDFTVSKIAEGDINRICVMFLLRAYGQERCFRSFFPQSSKNWHPRYGEPRVLTGLFY